MKINQDTALLIAEQQNIANTLVGNFASMCLNLGAAKKPKDIGEYQVGLKIANDQLVKFIGDLIADKGNKQLACNNIDYKS
jgi:hypothetical protein